MWVILPVKQFRDAKHRLSDVLTGEQRATLTELMVIDVLEVLAASDVVDGITVVSCDPKAIELADQYGFEHLLTETDSGHSADAAHGISSLTKTGIDKIALLPLDVPTLSLDDLRQLDQAHTDGITLCPAPMDGGTNAVVFSPPLQIPLLFGKDSLKNYQAAATGQGVEVRVTPVTGLERDIDRPEDLEWLAEKPSGGRAWAYVRELTL